MQDDKDILSIAASSGIRFSEEQGACHDPKHRLFEKAIGVPLFASSRISGRRSVGAFVATDPLRSLFSLTLALLCAANALWAASAVPLHTHGPHIVDPGGTRVHLSAVNWYGAEGSDFVVMGLEKRPLFAIVQSIKSRGFNSVRLPWSNEMYEKNPVVDSYALTANSPLRNQRAMAVFDAVVNALTRAGLMVILDNHTSTAAWCCNRDSNDLWYSESYPLSNWLSDWEGMVSRYKNNKRVIGVDLRNEPRGAAVWGGGGSKDWRAAAITCGNLLLARNHDLLIFVEGIDYGRDLSGMKSAPISLNIPNHLVYEAHDYGFDYAALSSYDSWYKAMNPLWGYLVTGSNPQPLWLGEFGTCNTADNCIRSQSSSESGYWFEFMQRFLLQYSVDWAYWPLNGTTETGHDRGFGTPESYGILNPSWDGDALPTLTSSLQRLMQSSEEDPRPAPTK